MGELDIKFKLENITPDAAKMYLEKNVVNRKLKKQSIRSWSAIMKRGAWDITHQGIAFNSNGDLIDGQNRLHAVIGSGVTVPIMVARGLPHLTYRELSVDQGNKRTYADQYGHPKKASQIITLIAKICSTESAIALDVVDTYYGIYGKYAEMIGSRCNGTTRIFSSASVCAAITLRLFDESKNTDNRIDSILTQYRSTVIQDYSVMSPKIMAFVKFYNLNGCEGQYPQFARAYLAFDPLKEYEKSSKLSDAFLHIEKVRHKYVLRIDGYPKQEVV